MEIENVNQVQVQSTATEATDDLPDEVHAVLKDEPEYRMCFNYSMLRYDAERLLGDIFVILDASIVNKDQNRSVKRLIQEKVSDVVDVWQKNAYCYNGDVAQSAPSLVVPVPPHPIYR